MKNLVAILLTVLSPVFVFAQAAHAGSFEEIDLWEYAVYGEILEHIYKEGDLAGSKMFVISGRTEVEDYSLFDDGRIRDRFKEVHSETLSDFRVRNHVESKLVKRISTKRPYEFMDDPSAKSLVDKWQSFREKYPKAIGIITFSRVGGNDGKQALVYVSTECEGLCGEGNFYLLEYSNKGWKIVGKSMTWIA